MRATTANLQAIYDEFNAAESSHSAPRPQAAPLSRDIFKSMSIGGSNVFVVHGNHTASGKPILSSDPHLIMNSPSIWTPIHLECDEFDYIGVSIASVPYVFIGHSDYISIGMTLSYADQQVIWCNFIIYI